MGRMFHEFTIPVILQAMGDAIYTKAEAVNPVSYSPGCETDNGSEK